VIDLHCHVLPGIDDGPATTEQSLALARAAAACGTTTIVATPHSSAHYPNRAASIRELTAELNDRLRREQIPVELRPGAEVALTHAEELDEQELRRLRLGGGPWLLLEPPFLPMVIGIDRTIARLRGQGHEIVLAHPERCPAFHRDLDLLRALVEDGVLTSITAGSLVGRFGKSVRRFALRLLSEELVHNVASDAHDARRRPPGIAAELEQAQAGELADWLTRAVPEAILSGAEIPPRRASGSGRSRPRWLAWRR